MTHQDTESIKPKTFPLSELSTYKIISFHVFKPPWVGIFYSLQLIGFYMIYEGLHFELLNTILSRRMMQWTYVHSTLQNVFSLNLCSIADPVFEEPFLSCTICRHSYQFWPVYVKIYKMLFKTKIKSVPNAVLVMDTLPQIFWSCKNLPE